MNIENKSCVCKHCGVEILWGEVDGRNGIMWSCERCGDYVCSKCIEDNEEYREEMRQKGYGVSNLSEILCLDCKVQE